MMQDQRQRSGRDRDSGNIENVVQIRRVAKTVAGGRRFTFTALVVVGDGEGQVGVGQGKANEVPEAIRKGSMIARKKMIPVVRSGSTIPQQVVSKFGGAQVLLKPAGPGTGIRAGAAVRAVVAAAGIRDILTKSQGSSNHTNVVRATLAGLASMRQGRVGQAPQTPPPPVEAPRSPAPKPAEEAP